MKKLKNIDINSNAQFAAVISAIQKHVSAENVVQVWQPNNPFASKDNVLSLAVEGPWPDYIEMYFEELQSSKQFKLAVETFHGAGGQLEEIQ